MKRLLTHQTALRVLIGLWLGCLPTPVRYAFAAEEDKKPAEMAVKIKSRTFESHREADSTMTWIVQKTDYDDGLRVLTLAGVQHEDAYGLSVVLLDDVTPQKHTTTVAIKEGEKSEHTAFINLSDNIESSEEISDQGPARLQLQIRSLLVNMADLRQQAEVKESVPMCSGKNRRAVAFLRPAQLQRQLNLTAEESKVWSRFGRAACVRWSRLPEAQTSAKTADQTVAPSQPDAPVQKN
ncbi:MAG: hypothetical protein RLZZ488_35 [Pseudomonadota bacterium]